MALHAARGLPVYPRRPRICWARVTGKAGGGSILLVVARLILGPRAALRPGFVRVPVDLREPYAVFTLACIITLTPGTVSSSISEDRRWLLVHALDVDDEAALIADIRQRYELPLKEIFAC